MKKKIASKTMLYIRIAICVYLIYLSYDLGKGLDWKNSSDLFPMGAMCILFTLSGLGIIIYSLVQLKRGNYLENSISEESSGLETTDTPSISQPSREASSLENTVSSEDTSGSGQP